MRWVKRNWNWSSRIFQSPHLENLSVFYWRRGQQIFCTKNFRYCLLNDLTFSTNQIRLELKAFQNMIILSLFSAFHIDSYWRRETAQYLWPAFIEYFVVLKFYFTSKIMWIDIFKANNCTWRRNSRKPDNMLSILHIIVKTH